jgi:hypothetical protein
MTYLQGKPMLFDREADSGIKLISNKTYNESLLVEKILQKNTTELKACAYQLAVHGWGGKKLGKVEINGEVHEVKDLLEKNDVIISSVRDMALGEGDLTLKRLLRVFRFHIRDYLKETGQVSFIVKKYGNPGYKNAHMLFPTAEYLVSEEEDINELKLVYLRMDSRIGSSFIESLETVLKARTL